jgi:hypothetical protein
VGLRSNHPYSFRRMVGRLPQRLVLGDEGINERYGLIYKRECQEHFSPSAGCAGLFRDIQPLSPEKTLV